MTNVGVYVRRESTISQREIMGIKTDRVHFPKILICADSIHSKERTFDAYPKLNMTMIQQLYGLDVPAMAEVSPASKNIFESFFRLNFSLKKIQVKS